MRAVVLTALVVFLPFGANVRLVAASEEWQVADPPAKSVRLLGRSRQVESDREFIRWQFFSAGDFNSVQLTREHPPAAIIDDFKATIEVRSEQQTLRPGLHVVLPNQVDPRTGRPVELTIMGAPHRSRSEWQTLTIDIPRSVLDAKTRALRAELKRPDIAMSGAYVDGCVLEAELHSGASDVDVGRCTWGPVVKPQRIIPRADDAHSSHEASASRLTIDRDRILYGSTALFPRFMPDHGESPDFLRQVGTNMAWVPDLGATDRMQQLVDRGLFVIATPPHPEFDPADFSFPLEGLPPLEQTSPLPDAWYLGTAIRSDQLPHLVAWAREVRSADRKLRRPLMADLTGSEGVASRLVDSVGISQRSMSGFQTFGEARNRSFVRQNSSVQLTLPWEWIQTEHSAEYAAWRRRAGALPSFVEPEQILMQLVSCLSSGSRGIGFWKTRNVESTSSRDLETARAIELACLYLQIIEPLLIRGKVDGHIPIQRDGNENDSRGRSLTASVMSVSAPAPVDYQVTPESPDAAVINVPGTSLILAGFWDNASQFVPQQMFSENATLTVVATETASAWQVSPTAVRGYRRQSAAGGLKLALRDFDLLSMALVTADHDERRRLEARVQQHAERAARLFVDLARLKLSRVQRETEMIDDPVGRDSKSVALMGVAAAQLTKAENALQSRSFPTAEQYARASMRSLRSVQNRYWYRAIQSLPSPTASPHTVSFSTLRDHWKMMRAAETGIPSGNLLPTGDFEEGQQFSAGHWKFVLPDPKRHHAGAEVVSERQGRNQILRMRAWNRTEAVAPGHADPALLIQCPEIDVQKGDVLEISVRVRAGQGVLTTQATPFMVFDSDLGPELAVRPRLEPSWRTCRLFRQVSETGPLTIWLGLTSPAEVYVDDISVVRRARMSMQNVAPGTILTRDAVEGPPVRSRVQGAGYSNPSLR